jgi:hypothetical protein
MSSWTAAAKALRTGVVALVLLLATAGCADPDFVADGEDVRRLDVLKSDETYSYLVARTRCEEALARYVPRGGLPLDFAGISSNRIVCHLSNVETTGLLAAAEAAGWTPSVSVSGFQFRKKLGKIWASMALGTGADGLTVTLLMPEHTRSGDKPGSSETAEGRACLEAVRTKAPPTPSCSLAR